MGFTKIGIAENQRFTQELKQQELTINNHIQNPLFKAG
jgi:hypothetical protein